MNTENYPKNGYELATRILSHERGNVKSLIQIAGNQETEWLEFKASLHPGPEGFEKGENIADYQWHVIRAIIAMINTRGGVILLGVGDNCDSVGIQASFPNKPIPSKRDQQEAFVRKNIIENLLLNNEWETGKSGKWRLSNHISTGVVSPGHCMDYNDKLILPIFVQPHVSEFLVFNSTKDSDKEILLIRNPGYVGRVHSLNNYSEISAYCGQRKTEDTVYLTLWNSFISMSNSVKTSAIADILNAALDKYINNRILMKDEFKNDYDNYVDLYFSEFEEKNLFESYLDFSDNKELVTEDNFFNNCVIDNKPNNAGLVISTFIYNLLINKKNLIMVVGPGGSGKTTLLRYLSYKFGSEFDKNKDQSFLPVYVNIGERSYGIVKDGFKDWIAKILYISKENISNLFLSKNIVILIDGFNEISHDLSPKILSEIGDILHDYPNVNMIISTRDPFSIPDFENSVSTFLLSDLVEEQAIEIISKHIKATDEIDRKKKAKNEWDKLITNEIIKKLALHPFSLRLIIESSVKNQDSIGLILRNYVKKSIERELSKNKIGYSVEIKMITYKRVVSKLSDLAINIIARNQYPIEECHFDDFEKLSNPIILARGAGLLNYFEENDMEYCKFKHDLIRDYFISETLRKDTSKLNFIIETLNNDKAYVKERISILKMATELSTDPSGFLRDSTIMGLSPLWRKELLENIRIPKAIPALEQYCELEGKTKNPFVINEERGIRKSAAHSLSQIPTEEAINSLHRLTQSKDWVTRLFAIAGLGACKYQFKVLNILVKLIMDDNPDVSELALKAIANFESNLSYLSRLLLKCYTYGRRNKIKVAEIAKTINYRLSKIEKEYSPHIFPDKLLNDELSNMLNILYNNDLNRKIKNFEGLINSVIRIQSSFGPAISPPQIVVSPRETYDGIYHQNPFPGLIDCDAFSGSVPICCAGFGGFVDGQKVSFSIRQWGSSTPQIWVVEKINKYQN